MYIRGIYDGSLGSQRHDLPLHAAIHGHDLAAVITDVKALRTEDSGKLTKNVSMKGGDGKFPNIPEFRNIAGYKSTNQGDFSSQRSKFCRGLNSHLWTKCQEWSLNQ